MNVEENAATNVQDYVEVCLRDWCQVCSSRQDARVDLQGTAKYEDIDLGNTPIIVLGCGPGFTFDYLDQKIGILDVYVQDENGKFIGLNSDFYSELSISRPRCPDCNIPIWQNSSLVRSLGQQISHR